MPSSDPQKPFWTIGLTPIRNDVIEAGETFDALVVGAGCAGLNAAIELATEGLKVGIVEAQTFGEGAASKAAGALANSLKARLGDIAWLYGQDVAIAAYDEAVRARVFTEDMNANTGSIAIFGTGRGFWARTAPKLSRDCSGSCPRYSARFPAPDFFQERSSDHLSTLPPTWVAC